MKHDPPVKIFHDFTIALASMITKVGHNSDEIHIVFNNYRESSVNNMERRIEEPKLKKELFLI